jgi:hypothetical protein
VALGVLAIDTILADNRDGCSTMTAERVGKLLGCDRKYVDRARELLAKDGLLGRQRLGKAEEGKRGGLGYRQWPIVNRAFAGESLPQTWWFDATSEPSAPRGNHSGNPRTKPGTSDVSPLASAAVAKPGTSDVSPLVAKPETSDVAPLRKRWDIPTLNLGHPTSHDITKDITRREEGGADAPSLPSPTNGANGHTPQDQAGLHARLTQAQIDAVFAEWYAAYPRKEAKIAAKKAYTAIVTGKRKDPEERATPHQLLAALEAAKKAGKFPNDAKFIKHPATWLNDGSWADHVGASAPLSLDDEIRQLAQSPDGRELLKQHGAEEGMRLLRELVTSKRKGRPQ